MFLNVTVVYMSNLDVREMCISLKAINSGGKKAPFMLIFLRTELFKYYFNNNIDSEVLFGTNKETSLGYTND
jgi:hypothetical protein